MDVREELEIKALKCDGEEFFAQISILKMEFEGATYMTAILRDVSRSKVLECKLKTLSEIDDLTGLMNRRKIEQCAGAEIPRSSRYGKALSILVMDIDYFKVINDTHGHDIGGQVLRKFADVVSSNL